MATQIQSLLPLPIDLDSIIFNSDTTPNIVENELNVDERIIYESISASVASYWLYKTDNLRKFSKDFRRTLFKCLDANPYYVKCYLIWQLSFVNNESLYSELIDALGGEIKTENERLMNPINLLGNSINKKYDIDVLAGKMTLRDSIKERIDGFIKNRKNKDILDFRHSLFLPEILNPKFFRELDEVEQVAILGNIVEYSIYGLTFYRRTIFSSRSDRASSKSNVLQPYAILFKDIFSLSPIIRRPTKDAFSYTYRVKMFAWRKFMELLKHENSPTRIFENDAVMQELHILFKKKEISIDSYLEWLERAKENDVFELFELDCTLHNVDATDFLMNFLIDKTTLNLAKGLMDFQDSETRVKLLNDVADKIRLRI